MGELVEGKTLKTTPVTLKDLRGVFSVPPLARKNDENPALVDRFELYIAGRELANAFSELNDPADQRDRFLEQMAARAAGDDTANPIDEDYVRALEYGMPPAAELNHQFVGVNSVCGSRRAVSSAVSTTCSLAQRAGVSKSTIANIKAGRLEPYPPTVCGSL